MTLGDPELITPRVHCFAKCHWCKRLVPIQEGSDGLRLAGRECPHCKAELSESRIRSSFVVNLFHTSAITAANKFISLDLAVIPFLFCTVLLVWMGFPLWVRVPYLLIYHAPILLALRWFRKYWYHIRFDDDEYLEAVGRMRRFLAIWVAANLVNWVVLIAQQTYFASG